MSTETRLQFVTENDYERKMLRQSRVRTACCVVVALFTLFMFYHVYGVTGQVRAIIGALDTVSSQLEQADLTKMLGDVQDLVLDAQGMTADAQTMIADAHETLTKSAEGLDGAVSHISGIDIDGLNEAIGDLAAVIEPLARLFGR